MIQLLTWIMAAGALLGGLDRMLGNRFGLGKPFEEGFQMLGPVALSMAGIICLAPILSGTLGHLIVPVYHALHQDPAMFGSILAIDMGGYQMALGLADDPLVGRYAGILAGSILGCTVSFTIPTSMGLFHGEDRENFAKGLLYGLIALPFAQVLGALLCGISLLPALYLNLPVLLLSLFLIFALSRYPDRTLRGFGIFAAFLKILTTLGLAVGAFQYISDITLIPAMTPLEDAMKIICGICITLLGSLPVAEILKRVLRRPMARIGQRMGIGEEGVMGFLLFYLNATPGLVSVPQMNRRGQILNGAFAVASASCLTAHFAFTMQSEPALAMPLLLTKLFGGILGAAIAHAATSHAASRSRHP